ncbi:MAG: hypothetical protein ABIP20_06265 [Chthoniobacteraceae bacterium]
MTASVLSTFFGGATLPNNGDGPAVESSGIRQAFNAVTRAAFAFDYRYVSQEDIHSGFDETFFYLDGNIILLADSDSPGIVPISSLHLRYKNGTAYRTVRLELAAGTHTVGFGTYDTGDASGDGALIVDNIETVIEPCTAGFGIDLARRAVPGRGPDGPFDASASGVTSGSMRARCPVRIFRNVRRCDS